MVFTTGRRRQLSDHSFESDGGNVSELLFVRQHVGAQRVHDRLHLILLHFADQRAQADENKRTQTLATRADVKTGNITLKKIKFTI